MTRGTLKQVQGDVSALILLVRGLEAGELEPFADPFGELVEHYPRLALGIPADLAGDRLEAFDDDDDLLADAIFLDRLDFHAAHRNIVNVDRVIELADAHRCLAADVEARGTGTEAVARFAAGEKLADVDILIELHADHVPSDPHDRRRNA